MGQIQYEFVTIWRIRAPIEAVWEELVHPELWPTWWRGVQSVETIEHGENGGLGSIHRFRWKSRLPYVLTFQTRAVRLDPPRLLEVEATGELAGSGLWQLSSDGDVTVARYDWKVRATHPVMRFFAPVARPLFVWNHDLSMARGLEGLTKRLATPHILRPPC